MANRFHASIKSCNLRRARLCLEQLESRNLFHAGLAYAAVGANLTDPDGGTGGVDHIKQGSGLLADSVPYYIHSHGGGAKITAAQRDRIHDAVNLINGGNTGVTLVEVSSNSQADIHVHNNSSSGCGSPAQGVVGCAEYFYYTAPTGTLTDGHDVYRFAGIEAGSRYQAKVTMLVGWNFYTGAATSGIGSNQIDYQTVVGQELAHAVGLDHDENVYGNLNGDGHSIMYPFVDFGHPHRQFSTHDFDSLKHLYSGGPQSIVPPPEEGGDVSNHPQHSHDRATVSNPEAASLVAWSPLGSPRLSVSMQTPEHLTAARFASPPHAQTAETGTTAAAHFAGGGGGSAPVEQAENIDPLERAPGRVQPPAAAPPVESVEQQTPRPEATSAVTRTATEAELSSSEIWSRASTAFFTDKATSVSEQGAAPVLSMVADPGAIAAAAAIFVGGYFSVPRIDRSDKRRNWFIRC